MILLYFPYVTSSSMESLLIGLLSFCSIFVSCASENPGQVGQLGPLRGEKAATPGQST